MHTCTYTNRDAHTSKQTQSAQTHTGIHAHLHMHKHTPDTRLHTRAHAHINAFCTNMHAYTHTHISVNATRHTCVRGTDTQTHKYKHTHAGTKTHRHHTSRHTAQGQQHYLSSQSLALVVPCQDRLSFKVIYLRWEKAATARFHRIPPNSLLKVSLTARSNCSSEQRQEKWDGPKGNDCITAAWIITCFLSLLCSLYRQTFYCILLSPQTLWCERLYLLKPQLETLIFSLYFLRLVWLKLLRLKSVENIDYLAFFLFFKSYDWSSLFSSYQLQAFFFL